jgi:cell division protein FtsL
MTRRRFIAISLLLLLVLGSATAVVYAKYASRKHFVELERLRSERDAVEVEWGRLQLEQGAWATHGRVERVARKRLQMRIPSSSEVVVIRP